MTTNLCEVCLRQTMHNIIIPMIQTLIAIIYIHVLHNSVVRSWVRWSRMGISKLSSFMKDKYRWEKLNIAGRKLVIDGNNLCHYLYSENHEWRLGGSYPAFYDTVTQFFQTLTKHRITPIVVFDGITHKQSKKLTIRKRRMRSFQAVARSQDCQRKVSFFSEGVSPIFVKEVFLDALSDLEVEFYFVDGEADGEIAAIANYYDCPVLSLDSDFYIYDITGGFVPLGLLQWEKECTIPKCEVAVYHVSSFVNQFNLHDKSLRFLIPAILGNDSLKAVEIPSIASLDCSSVIRYAGTFSSFDDFTRSVCESNLLRNYHSAVKEYTVIPKPPGGPDNLTKSGHFPEWVLERFRHGSFQTFMLEALYFGHCILRPVFDDLDRHSSQLTSRPVRQSIYGVLGCQGAVTETLRGSRTELADAKVEPKLPPPIRLANILNLEPHGKEVKDIFYSVVGFDVTAQELIEELPSPWQLVTISLKYCFRRCDCRGTLSLSVKALVACFLSYSSYSMQNAGTYNVKQGSFELDVLHSFAQWQCVYCDMIALNQLLDEPFEYVSPAKLFDGDVAMYYATLCKMNMSIDAMVIEASCGWDIYEQIYIAVTSKPLQTKQRQTGNKCMKYIATQDEDCIATENGFAIIVKGKKKKKWTPKHYTLVIIRCRQFIQCRTCIIEFALQA